VVEAESATTLSVSFPARVEEVLFEEGQSVAKGQVLVRFDTEKRSLRVKQSQAAVDASKAALENARTELERVRSLEATGATTPQLVDRAENAHRQAAAAFQDAVAARGLARRELSDATLKSPMEGVVDRRDVEPGETVTPGHPLAVIQGGEALEVLTHVTEKDVNFLRLGGSASVSASAARGRTYHAQITTIGVAADPRTGNFAVRLRIDSEGEGLLRPGMTTRVRLQGEGIPDAIVVPEDAVVDRDRQRVVFLAVDGHAVQVVPVIGLTSSELVHVVDGLEVGDELIVDGLVPIVDGSKIEIRGAEPSGEETQP
jgi:membrane fusion protein (multidrug efflux system)